MTFDANEILAYRKEKDHAFRNEADSPIPPAERHRFPGLSYFPPDPAYYVATRLTAPPEPRTIRIPTSDGDERVYQVAGLLPFLLAGHKAQLTAFREDEHDNALFIPFKDTTAPHETYGAGRYLDLPWRPSGALLYLDFNLAYNPYCAYNDEFSCPFPPEENWLPFPVRAGERVYEARSTEGAASPRGFTSLR